MRVNDELTRAASFNPTKRTYQIPILKICEKIEEKAIILPLYQRDVSWTKQKCVDLFNYQLTGKAPVAPISINEINNVDIAVEQISFIDRKKIENVQKGQMSIADGQQRLTTNYKAYINYDEFKNIVLDLSLGKFLIKDGDIKSWHVPVGILLNKEDDVFFKYINNVSALKKIEIANLLLRIRNKIRDYNYTINFAEDLTEEEQIEWFEVLNNAGSRVTRIQMRFAKLKAKGIDIYVQYTKVFKKKLDDEKMDLFKVKDTEVSIPVATLNSSYELVTGRVHSSNYAPIPSDAKEIQLCELDETKLVECFDMTLNALDRAIKFVKDNKLVAPIRIDFMTYLTGFFVFAQGKELDEEETKSVIKWYEKTSFTNRSNSERREMFTEMLKLKK